jgi:hypothetical protein
MNRATEKLALLVGSNPLPNHLAATVRTPKEVLLLDSPDTADPCERLQTALSAKGLLVSKVCIEEATDARRIRDACRGLRIDHLHHSGGTKPRAAHARAPIRDESRASYLDECKDLLRFDDGYDIALADPGLGAADRRPCRGRRRCSRSSARRPPLPRAHSRKGTRRIDGWARPD